MADISYNICQDWGEPLGEGVPRESSCTKLDSPFVRHIMQGAKTEILFPETISYSKISLEI